MFDFSSSTFSEKERVVILFKEYDTLRSEAISRTSGGYQLVGILAALAAALLAWLSSHPVDYIRWVAFACFLVIAFCFAFVTYRDINMIAARLREIESEVNQAVGGREILKWESRWGSVSTGWVWRTGPKSTAHT